MAGLRKMKKYNWKDSNMANFGSKEERKVKKESAMTEPAWEGAGQTPGLQIWRIEKFQVKHWPKEEYGRFFNGDSYIVLKTTEDKKSDGGLALHVHFWIGKHSSQDEYGTAAYKTVELDTLLDDRAVQHREVDGHESKLFMKYFESTGFTVMDGGVDTGFRHVEPEKYKPRLLHFCGSRRDVEVRQVPLCRGCVNSEDVYILDLGRELYQFNGKYSSKDERFKAMSYLSNLKVERSAESEVLEEEMVSPTHKFYTSLTEEEQEDDPSDDESGEDDSDDKKLFRLSDAGGQLAMDKVKTGDCAWDDFKSEDVFLLHHSSLGVYIWIGSGASVDEKRNGFCYAHEYLKKQKKCYLPVSVVREGCTFCSDMELALTA